MSEGQYSHTNSKGVKYYLNSKNVVLRGGHERRIYYFSKDAGRLEACSLPDGWQVTENTHNGFLTIKQAK